MDRSVEIWQSCWPTLVFWLQIPDDLRLPCGRGVCVRLRGGGELVGWVMSDVSHPCWCLRRGRIRRSSASSLSSTLRFSSPVDWCTAYDWRVARPANNDRINRSRHASLSYVASQPGGTSRCFLSIPSVERFGTAAGITAADGERVFFKKSIQSYSMAAISWIKTCNTTASMKLELKLHQR